MGVVALMAAVGLAVVPAGARAQQATAGIGLSDSAAGITCTLYPIAGCPPGSLAHALFDRYQALAGDQTGGANAFRYVRAGIPWDAVSTGATAIGGTCRAERPSPAFYGTPWVGLAESFVLAARRAGLDPLIAITTNSASRYTGNGNPADPANPSANQYLCGFKGIVSADNRRIAPVICQAIDGEIIALAGKQNGTRCVRRSTRDRVPHRI